MTEPQDPFSDRPYVPPTSRDDEQPTETPDAPIRDEHPTQENPTVEQAAGPLHPTEESTTAEPVVPGTPTYSHRYPTAEQFTATAPPAGPGGGTAVLDEPTVAFGETPPPFAAAPAAAGAAAPKRRLGRKVVSAVAIVALAGAAGYGGAYLEGRDDTPSSVVSSLDNDAVQTNAPTSAIEAVASKLLPSVVKINVSGGGEAGSGTGVIISSDGNILTNNHVVSVAGDNGTITVAFNDGTNTEAKIVGTDPRTDLAIIKAEGKTDLTPATLGTSSDLQVGQDVVAIGSPFGLESTVTSGIVSALNRPVTSSDGSGQDATIFPAVQTDAAINPGNSGGPLVDLQGRVIGINSAIQSSSGGTGEAGSIGLGFAIPIDLAKHVSEQLLAGGEVAHAQIGVTVQQATSDDQLTGLGARIQEVNPGSAGEKAGLRQGDLITAINGNAVSTNDALVASILAYEPGDTVKLTVQRDDKTEEIDVTLGSDADS